jgi:uncharacterized protein (TIGR00304 family)
METQEIAEASEEDEHTPPNLFIILIIGFAMTIVGLMLVVAATSFSQGDSSSFGGVIFIGPIPIVFGAGPEAHWLILFAIILAVLSVIMLLTLRRKSDGMKD